MDDGKQDEWVRIVVPKDGIFGEPPVKIRMSKICKCGEAHEFDPPNPQAGEWYSYVLDPCEHTITYVSIWENKL